MIVEWSGLFPWLGGGWRHPWARRLTCYFFRCASVVAGSSDQGYIPTPTSGYTGQSYGAGAAASTGYNQYGNATTYNSTGDSGRGIPAPYGRSDNFGDQRRSGAWC